MYFPSHRCLRRYKMKWNASDVPLFSDFCLIPWVGRIGKHTILNDTNFLQSLSFQHMYTLCNNMFYIPTHNPITTPTYEPSLISNDNRVIPSDAREPQFESRVRVFVVLSRPSGVLCDTIEWSHIWVFERERERERVKNDRCGRRSICWEVIVIYLRQISQADQPFFSR